MLQANPGNQNNSEFNLNSENFEQNWPVLGLVNIDAIIPENFPKTIKYWAYMASNVISTLKNKSDFNSKTLIQMIQVSRTSVLFSLYSYERSENCLEPITFLSGMVKPSSAPDQTDFPLFPESQTSEALCKFSEVCKYLLKTDFTVEQIINCSIFFSFIELNFYGDPSLFDHFNNIFGCTQLIPENEVKNILNFENINSLLEALRRVRLNMNQPIYFILKFMYENLFNYQFSLSYIQDDFYKNLISKGIGENEIQTIILTCFNYIHGAPIQFEPSKFVNNQILFCYLCLNSLVLIDDTETFFSKFSIELDPWIFFIYAFYNNVYTKSFAANFIDFLEIKELNESWKSALNFILESKDINAEFDQPNPYLKSIKSIFSVKNRNNDDQTKDENSFPQIPDKISDDLTAPTLFWYNYNKQAIKIETIIDLLTKLKIHFQECLQNTVAKHPIFIHSESLDFHSNLFPAFIPPLIPTKPEDFLTAPPPLPPTNCYTIINLILSQLIEISIQFKYNLPADLLIPFYYNYYIAPDIKDKIDQLGGKELNEKAIEDRALHLESIFDVPDSNDDKYECLTLVLSDLTILPFAYKFIIRLLKSDDKYIPIITQIFSSTSFLKKINSLNQDEIENMLNSAIDRNLQHITKSIITNLTDSNFVASYISSIAYQKPIIALFLYKNVSNNINSSQIISLLSNKSKNLEFPKDISTTLEFLNFLITLSKSVPHVPFIYQNIIRSKQLPTTWEEDSASKSNEILTKAFINIWEYPPMTKDDVENARNNILNSTNNCLHIHEGSNLCNTIFEKFCCTYNKGKITQPCFFCYTCGLTDRFLCCLGCAMTCHRGHDIVFIKNADAKCDCYRMPQMCIFNPNQENLLSQEELAPPNIEMTLDRLHQLIDEGGDISFHQRQLLSALFNNERIQEVHAVPPYFGFDGQEENFEQDEITPRLNRNIPQGSKSGATSKSFPINKKNILSLFLKIAKLKIDENINENTKQFDLCWQDIVKIDKSIELVPIELSDNSSISLIDCNIMQRAFSENDRITHIMQRCVNSSLGVATFVTNKMIVVSDGKSLFSYQMSSLNKKIASIEIPGLVTQIISNKIDPSIIAVTVLTQVYIVKVKEEDGSFIIQHDKIIKYEKSDESTSTNDNKKKTESNNVVLNAFWLNSSSSKIAVLFRDRMLFYDLKEEGKSTLYMTLKSKSSDPFNSAVIVNNNDEEFVILTLESGPYIIQQLPSKTDDKCNEIIVNELFTFQWFPEKPIVSYCPSSEFFFVISADCQIAIIKKKDFFNKNQRSPFIVCASGAPGNLVFIGNHPKNRNVYLFFHVLSGGILTIQICGSKVFYSLNNYQFDCYRFPILTKDKTPLAFLTGPSFTNDNCDDDDHLYSLSMDGHLNEIRISSISPLLSSTSSSSTTTQTKRKKSKKSLSPPHPPHLSSRPYRSRYSNNDNDDNDENFIQIDNLDENIGSDNDDDDEGENNDGDSHSRYNEILIRSLRSILSDENNGGGNRDENGDLIDPLIMDQQIKVPPFFWSNSRISTDENIKIFIPSFERNPRIILENQKVIFDHSLRKKFIEVSCMSETEVIIGFSFYVSPNSSSSHRPPYLLLNGRVTKVDQPRWYMLPLAANEIEEKKAYRVEMGSRGGLDINCDGFCVFVIEKSLIENSIALQLKKLNIKVEPKSNPSKKHEWFFDSSSLFSFNDAASSYGIKRSKRKNTTTTNNDSDSSLKCKKEKENNNVLNRNLKKFLKQLSFMFSPEPLKNKIEKEKENNNNNNENENDNDNDNDKKENYETVVVDDSLDDESIKELIELIYTNNRASIPARRILLKIIIGNKSSDSKDEDADNDESDSILFEKNKKIIGMWVDVMQSLLKEKKVLPDLWDVFLRDYSLMPKQEQNKVSDLLWENNPPKNNEFAFFSAFVS